MANASRSVDVLDPGFLDRIRELSTPPKDDYDRAVHMLLEAYEQQEAAHQEFRLQNDREWRAKLEHVKAALSSSLQGEAVPTEVKLFDYDRTVMTLYQQTAAIDEKYGDRVLDVEEIRDSAGYLTQFKVTLSAAPPPPPAPDGLVTDAMVAAGAQLIDPIGMFGLTWQECLERSHAVLTAALAPLAGREGWQLVPIEPTQEMASKAAWLEIDPKSRRFRGSDATDEVVGYDRALEIYRAMLSAAPSPVRTA